MPPVSAYVVVRLPHHSFGPLLGRWCGRLADAHLAAAYLQPVPLGQFGDGRGGEISGKFRVRKLEKKSRKVMEKTMEEWNEL